MTVQYNTSLATTTFFGFFKLLVRWRGSIYKLIWKDFIMFMLLYFAITLLYAYVMPEKNKRDFEAVASYCHNKGTLLPFSFVLGFYCSQVVSRFWAQFNTIPWPMQVAVYVSAYLRGTDEMSRMMRRTIIRYLCLSFVLTMVSISPQVKKRFPTLTHFTEAGFLLPNEQQILESMPFSGNKYFVPFVWSTNIIDKARKEGKIKEDIAVQKLLNELNNFRGSCGGLFGYDWITIPLVYTQVVTVAVYIYLIASLIGERKLDNFDAGEQAVPVLTFLKFFFYMGWLKVAEVLFNPFGEDDDDFEVNVLIDRHLQETYLVVDDMHDIVPDMEKDVYWDTPEFDLPYTESTKLSRGKAEVFAGSAAGVQVPENKQQFVYAEEAPSNANVADDNTDITKSNSSTTMKRSAFHRRATFTKDSRDVADTEVASSSLHTDAVGMVQQSGEASTSSAVPFVIPSDLQSTSDAEDGTSSESASQRDMLEDVWISPTDRMRTPRPAPLTKQGLEGGAESARIDEVEPCITPCIASDQDVWIKPIERISAAASRPDCPGEVEPNPFEDLIVARLEDLRSGKVSKTCSSVP